MEEFKVKNENYKAIISKEMSMPSICTLCTSLRRNSNEEVKLIPNQNSCFVDKMEMLGLTNVDDKIKESILTYQPFTNSKRSVRTICKNFSHIKSIRTW